jgi:transcriptional regulator with XRE-family HTH domain
MSQTELGEKLGVSFQQVQKYENGTNRVGSGRLYQIAGILGLHVSTFFKGGEGREGARDTGLLDLLAEPQSVRLIRAFAKITDNTVRRSLVQLAEKFAKSP